jgi:sirohydrochlorin cobaltochelatase
MEMTDNTENKKHGVLVCGHGSRAPAATAEFVSVVDALRALLPEQDVDFGFLELATPDISHALQGMYQRGCRKISALPGMLFAAAHVKQDIPKILLTFQAAHPDVEITLGRELGVSDLLIDVATQRIQIALDEANRIRKTDPDKTVLLVVGRGSRDEAALRDQEEITRRVCQTTGLKHSRTCYASVASPKLAEILADVAQEGFGRVILLPWFLFTGVIVDNLLELFEECSQSSPETEFIKISHFGDHPLIAHIFAQRYHEISGHAD